MNILLDGPILLFQSEELDPGLFSTGTEVALQWSFLESLHKSEYQQEVLPTDILNHEDFLQTLYIAKSTKPLFVTARTSDGSSFSILFHKYMYHCQEENYQTALPE